MVIHVVLTGARKLYNDFTRGTSSHIHMRADIFSRADAQSLFEEDPGGVLTTRQCSSLHPFSWLFPSWWQ